MIRHDCEYFVGDEDCNKCLEKGLIADCAGCTVETGGKCNVSDEQARAAALAVVNYCEEHECEKCMFEVPLGCAFGHNPQSWAVKGGDGE